MKGNKIRYIYIAAASLFFSTKYQDKRIELKLLVESVMTLAKRSPSKQLKIEYYITSLEHTLIGLFGTKLTVEHPSLYIKKVKDIYNFDDDFIHLVNFLITAILHYTDIVIRFKSEMVAVISIYIASKWNYLEFQKFKNKNWFQLINPLFQLEDIKKLSQEFLVDYKEIPNNLKVKIFELKSKDKSSLKRKSSVNQKKIISKDEYLKRNIETSKPENVSINNRLSYPFKSSQAEATPESYMNF